MPEPLYYLIWKDIEGVGHEEFETKEELNKFLNSLDSSSVQMIKIMSGYTLDYREA